MVAGSTSVEDSDFILAAEILASLVEYILYLYVAYVKCIVHPLLSCMVQVLEEDLAKGLVYPRLDMIRHVSASIAAGVSSAMHDSGRATLPRPAGDMYEHCKSAMYSPSYDFEIV